MIGLESGRNITLHPFSSLQTALFLCTACTVVRDCGTGDVVGVVNRWWGLESEVLSLSLVEPSPSHGATCGYSCSIIWVTGGLSTRQVLYQMDTSLSIYHRPRIQTEMWEM